MEENLVLPNIALYKKDT